MVLTLFNLENSRAFRVLWLANELKVPITSRNYARIGGKKAVPEMAKDSGYTLGKSPCLVEDDFEGGGELRVVESANCMQYLVERYAPNSDLLPSSTRDFRTRTAVIGWMDFAETLMTHAIAIVYAVWFARPEDESAIENIAEKASANVCKDLDEVEAALKQGGPYLCGKTFTAADISVAFSCEYVLVKKIGLKGKPDDAYPAIKAWLRNIEGRPPYQETLKNGAKHDFCLLQQQQQQ